MAAALYWLHTPSGYVVAALVAMVLCGALVVLVLGTDCLAHYMPADQAESLAPPAAADFADTHAALATRPAGLSESARLDQLLARPPFMPQRAPWEDVQVAMLDELERACCEARRLGP